MNVKIIFSSAILLIILILALWLLRVENPGTLTCTARSNLSLSTQIEGMKIEGEVLLVFHILSDDEGYVSQIGSVGVNGKNYVVDRTTHLKFIGKDHDDYLRTKRVSILKNDNDNIPDPITDLLMSKQQLFFYKFITVTHNIYAIRDLRRTIMVCRTN
jgi:hypothetical protein